MSGTWTKKVVKLPCAGAAIAKETQVSEAQTLGVALDQQPALRELAPKASALVAELFSSERFRQLLLQS
ncbi:hypothetical protein FQK07_14390 [Synechococcus sp. BSF8S]|uniref:hypothetical protein n=1 Tax=Synechococcales TaxID=1890424 RepID=UPI0016298198|nr:MULTISPECIES: hypothetical protein [unclassified Synechococcus]MBC1262417.1 hypothetical protein [Synechococcus sp. BSF8S]MBC1265319.1 hypothetical protein [Synechococcus sp. BSA11S]